MEFFLNITAPIIQKKITWLCLDDSCRYTHTQYTTLYAGRGLVAVICYQTLELRFLAKIERIFVKKIW